MLSPTVHCVWTEKHTIILVHGSNLIRDDLALHYRISPADLQTLKPALCISPKLLENWRVNYLIEEKVRWTPYIPRLHSGCMLWRFKCLKRCVALQDSLAVQVPDEVLAPDAIAERFTLEFWRGTRHVGECCLPLWKIREGKAEQVRGSCFPRVPLLAEKLSAWCFFWHE